MHWRLMASTSIGFGPDLGGLFVPEEIEAA